MNHRPQSRQSGNCGEKNLEDSKNYDQVRPREKWDSVEQYVLYLKQFMAYKYAKRLVKDNFVLEIGCGAGYGANYLSEFASNIVAIDISKSAIAYCNKKYKKKKMSFLQASGLNIAIKNSSVDVAISFQVIEHIEPKYVRQYLTEIKRALKEGGIFVVSTPNKKLRLLPFQKPRNPEHKKEYDYRDLESALKEVFEDVQVYCLTGSPQIQLIEQNRVKQNPFIVYIIRPLIPLLKKMQLYESLSRLKKLRKPIVKKTQSLVSEETFRKIQISDFKVTQYFKDCLDFYGICTKISRKNRINI